MKSGTVAVIGKANAGKSTLINVLVGEKISIVSPKPQTTRDRILGILTEDEYQMAFIDTPGIYKAGSMLNSRMQKIPRESIEDADVILFLIDAHDGISDLDKKQAKSFIDLSIPTIIVLTKTDIMPESLLINEIKELADFNAPIIPVSARKKKNLKELKNEILKYFDNEDMIFPDNIVSDKSLSFMIKEIMREKILCKYDKEIPHGIAVFVQKFELRKDGVYDIVLDIVCEKENHKGIIIGKGGKALKEVNVAARQEMERFLEKKVFLQTFVKVKEDWRNSANSLKEYGYSKEE